MFQSAGPQQQFAAENPILKTMVLEILHRPQREATSLKEIARELADHYDYMEVERCLLTLSEQGQVELAYATGYGVGFRAIPRKHW